MKITSEIRRALQIAVDSRGYGGQTLFAKEAGINSSYISRYLSEGINEITSENWDKIWPLIKEFVNEDSMEVAMPKYKSRYTKSLIEVFEKLDRDNQLEILGCAEDVLDDQELEQDNEFSVADLQQLKNVGITCEYGMEFSVTLHGLCWIYNVILAGRFPRNVLSNSILKEMLKIDISFGYYRELRIKLLDLDVYKNKKYKLLTIYLNGSPPKLSTSILCINGVNKTFTLPAHVGNIFKLPDNSIFDLHFSDQEYKNLMAGKTVKVE